MGLGQSASWRDGTDRRQESGRRRHKFRARTDCAGGKGKGIPRLSSEIFLILLDEFRNCWSWGRREDYERLSLTLGWHSSGTQLPLLLQSPDLHPAPQKANSDQIPSHTEPVFTSLYETPFIYITASFSVASSDKSPRKAGSWALLVSSQC